MLVLEILTVHKTYKTKLIFVKNVKKKMSCLIFVFLQTCRLFVTLSCFSKLKRKIKATPLLPRYKMNDRSSFCLRKDQGIKGVEGIVSQVQVIVLFCFLTQLKIKTKINLIGEVKSGGRWCLNRKIFFFKRKTKEIIIKCFLLMIFCYFLFIEMRHLEPKVI